ncbi:DUF2254 domain-containing protein [Streptomyces sp. CS090A]|uniref:DUF2254 domain-containing protein n=1 Tax=Streptomyces sp. CS090A TaxID=2162710 RepID=UPI000D513336|nr:DUF2254 domain-containing protein [Streptomyces sp. CS090A]PVC83362.1 DUF2254 domain-containing protein [Streptomyces sp. CS090A]
MSDRGYRRPRPLSPLREHLRDTFWFAPTMGFVCVFVLWLAASALDEEIVTVLQREEAYDELSGLISFVQDAKTIVTTISSAMMTFIGVVFSISLVAVQMASGQLTPRVVRIFVRSRISKVTLTVFLATFLFSLLVLTSYESEADPRLVVSVPLLQSMLTLVLVGLSLLLFVVYVSATLRLMQVGPVVDKIARDSFRVLGRMPRGPGGPEGLGPETGRVVHEGRAGVLRDVNTARLVRAARRQDVVLRLIPRLGDFMVPGTPVLAVHGGAAVPSRWQLRYTVSVGVERTLHQDLAFGLRQLVDIALRALSTSVNDPTTAVQCLDRIVQFLAAVARLPLGTVHHRDRSGRVRLVQEGPDWEDLVDLAFEEIRWCVAGSPQVSRRLLAGLDDLLLLAPEERKQPLVRHRALLVQVVERTVPVAADREFALLPDRQGIG